MDTLYFTMKCNRRTFMKVGVSSATLALIGCATSASSTWHCSNGVCVGKGLTITKIDENRTEVTMDAVADKSAHDSMYFRQPLLTWNPSLSIGVKQVDEQHIKLIYLANSLDDAMKTGNGNNVLSMIFSGLVSYTATHFRDEERLMSAYGYPEIALHKKQHEDLTNQVLELKRKFASGSAYLSMEVLDFLKDWVRKHIQGDDKKFGAYLNTRGIY